MIAQLLGANLPHEGKAINASVPACLGNFKVPLKYNVVD